MLLSIHLYFHRQTKRQMISRTRQYRAGAALILCTVVIGVTLLVCPGCRKDNSGKSEKVKFEVDKDYQRGPLTVHVRVDKTKLNIAQTLLLELKASIGPGYDVQMPKVDKMLEHFGIVDWDDLGDKLDPNNNTVRRYRYRLEPFLSGNFQIPDFTFEFYDVNSPQENRHKLSSDPIDVEVTSLLGKQRAKLVIADIEDVVEMPRKSSYRWLWALAVVGVIGVGVTGWIYLRRKKHAELIRTFKPAHEIAYARLQALVKEDLIEAGRLKEFYERISDILRHYIEHRFNLRAPERTTEEFLIDLSQTDCLASDDKAHLGEFLKHCDLVKFARHNPTREQIQKTFDLVKDFIEKTKSDEKQIDVTNAAAELVVEVGSV